MKSKRVEILTAAIVLLVSASPVMAVIEFNDGGTYDILANKTNKVVEVWIDFETPGMGTTVNILEGGIFGFTGYDLKGFEDSIINLLGGSIASLGAYGRSQVTVSAGVIGGRQHLYACDNSRVTVSGGRINNFRVYDSSQATISGGWISILSPKDSSQVTVSGGQMGALSASDSSQVTVSGGQMGDLCASDSSQVTISGGVLEEALIVDSHGTMAIYGSDFAVDGTPVGYIELSSILGGPFRNEPHRRLTGTLASGEPINNDFQIGHSAKIVLVPEPATLLLLGFGGLMLKRKR